jgi:hypothetical protein
MYVDEFQNFATESFASILSEARKYHLSLTLAHQYIGQLVTNDGNTKVRDAVFGNVGTIITFRIGAADGEFLEKEFMPEFLQNDLVNLAKANIYIKLMIDGVSSKPFSATTLPPHTQPLQSYKDIIIKNTREHYAVPRKIVDERIASEWNGQSDAVINEKIGRRDEKSLAEALRPATPRTSAPLSRPVSKVPEVTPVKIADQKTPLAAVSEPASAISNSISAPRQPSVSAPAQAPAPKQFVRQKVDIEELRRSITESLKKQAEDPSPAATPSVSELTQINAEPPGKHSK